MKIEIRAMRESREGGYITQSAECPVCGEEVWNMYAEMPSGGEGDSHTCAHMSQTQDLGVWELRKEKYEKPAVGLVEFLFWDDRDDKYITKEELGLIEEAKEFGDMPSFCIEYATAYGQPVALIYRNNGSVSIGGALEEFDLGPELWENTPWDDPEWVEFSDDEDAATWSGDFDSEAIMQTFFPRGGGYGDFVGAYYIIED